LIIFSSIFSGQLDLKLALNGFGLGEGGDFQHQG
jgi:hypothetical protein